MYGVIVKLKSIYASLPEVERKVADYIIKHYENVPYQSISEIADSVGASVPSVTRVAKKIGFKNFRDFKVSLAKDGANTLKEIYSSITPEDVDDVIIDKVFLGNIKTLEDSLKILNKNELSTFARKLACAKRIIFFGIGSSGYVAAEAALRFSCLDIQAEAYNDPIQLLLQSTRLDRNCIAIGISHSGRTKIVCDTIKSAKSKEATTCFITNYINAPIKDSCDYFFCTAYSENEVKAAALSSILAQITLTDTLYLLTAGYKKRIWNINELNNMIEKTLRVPY